MTRKTKVWAGRAQCLHASHHLWPRTDVALCGPWEQVESRWMRQREWPVAPARTSRVSSFGKRQPSASHRSAPACRHAAWSASNRRGRLVITECHGSCRAATSVGLPIVFCLRNVLAWRRPASLTCRPRLPSRRRFDFVRHPAVQTGHPPLRLRRPRRLPRHRGFPGQD